MDRKSLLAMVLCFLIFIGWQKLYIEPRTPHHPEQSQTAAPPTGESAPQGAVAQGENTALAQSSATTPTHHPAETRVLAAHTGDAIFGDGNSALVGWNLKSYRLGLTNEAAAVDLKSVTNQNSNIDFAFDDPTYAYLSKVQGNFQNTPTGVSWTYEDANVKLRRDFTPVGGEPYLNMTMSAEFKSRKPNYFFLSLASESPEKDPEAQDRQLLYWSDKSLERIRVNKEVKLKDVITPVRYIAASNRYFLLTLVNQGRA